VIDEFILSQDKDVIGQWEGGVGTIESNISFRYDNGQGGSKQPPVQQPPVQQQPVQQPPVQQQPGGRVVGPPYPTRPIADPTGVRSVPSKI